MARTALSATPPSAPTSQHTGLPAVELPCLEESEGCRGAGEVFLTQSPPRPVPSSWSGTPAAAPAARGAPAVELPPASPTSPPPVLQAGELPRKEQGECWVGDGEGCLEKSAPRPDPVTRTSMSSSSKSAECVWRTVWCKVVIANAAWMEGHSIAKDDLDLSRNRMVIKPTPAGRLAH